MNAKTHTTALDDLSYIRTMAEEGRHAPLIGGRIGLMWGCLLTVTLLLHGLTELGITGLSSEYIGLFWFIFGITGGILTFILSKSLKDKPGLSAVTNRIESAVWTASTLALFTVAIAVTLAVTLRGQSLILYDMIMAFAFATQAMNYYVVSQVTGQKSRLIPAALSLAFAALTILFIGQPIIYIVASIGVIFTIILPALMDMKKEPKNVV